MPWILRTALLLVAVSVLLSTGAVAHAGQEKVEVCHITGTATVDGVPDTPVGHVISVAAPAYRAHIAHGDPEEWKIVVLDDGRNVCTPVGADSGQNQVGPDLGAVAHVGQEKVQVCHITGIATVDGVPDTPVGHVIRVAAPAYRAHIAHGDPEQWNVVTLDDGRTVCTPVAGESARYQPKPGHVPIHRGRFPAHRR